MQDTFFKMVANFDLIWHCSTPFSLTIVSHLSTYKRQCPQFLFAIQAFQLSYAIITRFADWKKLHRAQEIPPHVDILMVDSNSVRRLFVVCWCASLVAENVKYNIFVSWFYWSFSFTYKVSSRYIAYRSKRRKAKLF